MHKLGIVVPDIHCPYHDTAFIKLIDRAIKKLKPDFMIQLGDFVDFWQLSTYDKNPERRNRASEDVQVYNDILDEWERLLPKGSVFHQIQGNHETRLQRYLSRNAPEAYEMVRSMAEQLKFHERNRRKRVKFVWHDYSNWKSCKIGDAYCFHGFYFNEHVTHTMLLKYGVKVICGHTHRVQFKSNGLIWTMSLGHGSDENQTAHSPTPTQWQQAFAVLTVVNGVTSAELVLVNNGKAIFRGEQL